MAGVSGMGNPQDINSVDTEAQKLLEGFMTAQKQQPQAQQADVANASAAPVNQDQVAPADSVNQEAANLLNGFYSSQQKAEDPERSVMDQIQQFPARLEASFANTPERKQFVLERRYGKDNVRLNKKDESFDIKKDGKWIKFDSNHSEVLNDFIADFGRDIVEQGSTELATAGGLAAAGVESFLTGGAGIPATPAIVAGSRVAGGMAGNALAQVIAHDIYGIPKGSVAEQAGEVALSGALNAVFGKVGDYVGSYFAKKGADKAIRIAGQSSDEALQTEIKIMEGATKQLESEKIIEPVKSQIGGRAGETTFLPEHAAAGKSTEVNLMAKDYADNPEVKNVRGKLMLGLNSIIERINNKIVNVPGISGTEALKYADDIETIEGKFLGFFRKKAAEIGGKVKVDATGLKDTLKSNMEELGFSFVDTIKKTPSNYVTNTPKSSAPALEIVRPTIESLEAKGMNAEKAASLVNRMEKMYKNVLSNTVDDKTRMSFQELSAMYTEYKSLVDPLFPKYGDIPADLALYRDKLKIMRNAIRDDYSKAIGAILGDTPAGQAYQKSLGDFTRIKAAKKDLSRILIDSASGEATMTGEALGKALFGNTKNTLKEINAAKNLFKDEPQIWDQIRRTYLDDLMKQSYDIKTKNYNVAGFAKKITDLPKDVAIELVGSKENLNLIKSAAVYADRLKNYTVEDLTKTEASKIAVVKATQFLTNFVGNKAKIIYDLFGFAGKDRAVARYLSDKGRDEILKLTPVDGRTAVSRVIDNIIEAGAFSENRAIKSARVMTKLGYVPAAKNETRNAVNDAVFRRDNQK